MVRILIADSHEIVLRGMQVMLEHEAGFQVVARATDPDAAVVAAHECRPDVAIVDFPHSYGSILETTRRVRAASPATEVLVFTSLGSETLAQDLLRAGARGYLLKNGSARELVAAVTAVARHQTCVSRSDGEAIMVDRSEKAPGRGTHLTQRERDVVRLIADGLGNKQISRELNLSVKTIESHRGAVIRKLGTPSAALIIRYAIRNGLVAA